MLSLWVSALTAIWVHSLIINSIRAAIDSSFSYLYRLRIHSLRSAPWTSLCIGGGSGCVYIVYAVNWHLLIDNSPSFHNKLLWIDHDKHTEMKNNPKTIKQLVDSPPPPPPPQKNYVRSLVSRRFDGNHDLLHCALRAAAISHTHLRWCNAVSLCASNVNGFLLEDVSFLLRRFYAKLISVIFWVLYCSVETSLHQVFGANNEKKKNGMSNAQRTHKKKTVQTTTINPFRRNVE